MGERIEYPVETPPSTVLQALIDAVADYGRTEENDDARAERDRMFDVQRAASSYMIDRRVTGRVPKGERA